MSVVSLEPALFLRLFPRLAAGDAAAYLLPFDAACTEYEINTPLRIAAFCAQIGTESADLTQWTENLNYSASRLLTVWPTRFHSGNVGAYAGQPIRTANKVYADRMGNGDEQSGDGWKYRGRGPIQLTGKANYAHYGEILGVPLVDNPDLAADPAIGLRIAACYWKDRGCNELADAGQYRAITFKINGGFNGWKSRAKRYYENRKILGITE